MATKERHQSSWDSPFIDELVLVPLTLCYKLFWESVFWFHFSRTLFGINFYSREFSITVIMKVIPPRERSDRKTVRRKEMNARSTVTQNHSTI